MEQNACAETRADQTPTRMKKWTTKLLVFHYSIVVNAKGPTLDELVYVSAASMSAGSYLQYCFAEVCPSNNEMLL